MMAESNSTPALPGLDGQLPHGEVHVWLADLGMEEDVVERLGVLLNREERERAARFVVASARKQFVAGRAFLRIVLGKYSGIDAAEVKFRLTAHGKPELAENPSLHFNLSDTEGLVAMAVTRVGAVGIDVERIREDAELLDLADRFFSEKEAAWVRSRDEPERASAFFSCWTAKEAYVKARGGGLSIPLDGFAVIPDTKKLELQLETFGDTGEASRCSMWRLELPVPFTGALAVQGAVRRVRVEWLLVR